MRFKASLAALAALASAFITNNSAVAGWDEPDLRPHSHHRSEGPDRYAYFYDPRGWYPYYNSGEWGHRYIKRFTGTLPPYYGAWGANNRRYFHVLWHRQHYGGHRRGDW